jgi:DNA-directed RNA polymerase specialized sigma24 family protein
MAMLTEAPPRSGTRLRHLALVEDPGLGTAGESDAHLRARFEHDVIPLLPRLCRRALRMTRHRADAEDVVEDTLVKACGGLAWFPCEQRGRYWKAAS